MSSADWKLNKWEIIRQLEEMRIEGKKDKRIFAPSDSCLS